MNYSGAVFFDYDGTLSDEMEGIYFPTESTVNTIKKLKEKGYFVCLATGRAKCYCPKLDVSFDGYITSNGASAEVLGKQVHSISIPVAFLEEAMSYFNKKGIYYSAETQKNCYARNINEPNFRSIIDNFNIPANIFLPISQIDKHNISKMLFAYPDEETFEEVNMHFNGNLKLDKHRFCNSADITLCGVTKGAGVKKILDEINVPFGKTFAFGDGTNDIEMMHAVNHSVAMGISSEELKRNCKYVTSSVKEEGITKFFKDFGLI